jgi:hypothetical protein
MISKSVLIFAVLCCTAIVINGRYVSEDMETAASDHHEEEWEHGDKKDHYEESHEEGGKKGEKGYKEEHEHGDGKKVKCNFKK